MNRIIKKGKIMQCRVSLYTLYTCMYAFLPCCSRENSNVSSFFKQAIAKILCITVLLFFANMRQ